MTGQGESDRGFAKSERMRDTRAEGKPAQSSGPGEITLIFGMASDKTGTTGLI